MAYYTPKSQSWLAPIQDAWLGILTRLACGPSTDPNKLAPAMAQYTASEEWPDWCRISYEGPYLIKTSFLSSLPRFMEGKQDRSIMDQIARIRLRRISHYKCNSDWNHEFVRADLVDEQSGTPLVMLWERDLPLCCGKPATKRELQIKLGLPCRSIDRVTYICERDFTDYVKMKDAYCLRTADFSSPGLDILQVACVLETHSLSFPTYHVYSTMCYWYADSTFEVLVDLSKAQQKICAQTAKKKGVFTYKHTNFIAYTGITKNSLRNAGLLNSGRAEPEDEDELYRHRLMELQQEVVTQHGTALDKALDTDNMENLTERERRSIRQEGWNVARYLDMIQDMLTHGKLAECSKARAAEVRAQLAEIQNGREAEDAKARREAQAQQCADMERDMQEEEAKWKSKMEKERAKVHHAEQQLGQERERAHRAEQQLEQERERTKKLIEEIAELKRQIPAF